MQVKHRDSGEIFALKTMRKNHVVQVTMFLLTVDFLCTDLGMVACSTPHTDYMLQKNDVVGVRTERSVLTRIRHPFIIKLKWAFHTPEVRPTAAFVSTKRAFAF